MRRCGVGSWLAAEPAWRGFKRAKGQSISEGDAEVGAVSVSLLTPWLLQAISYPDRAPVGGGG